MSVCSTNVLHVEDDEFQRKLIAHHLGTMKNFDFTIHCVDSESDAVSAFERTTFDLVILDYFLKEGNGGTCLVQLRHVNPFVPVIAISGGDTALISTELFRLGADAFINKRHFKGDSFTQSVRGALSRTDAGRQSESVRDGGVPPLTTPHARLQPIMRAWSRGIESLPAFFSPCVGTLR